MTVRNLISKGSDRLTHSERKLVAALLSDYPFAGLLSIRELAEVANVSPPSVSRFTSKIGLSSYNEMQRRLLEELREGERSPVELHDFGERIEGGYLQGFLGRAAEKIQFAGDAITEGQFHRVVTLFTDPKREIFALGGRISDTIALHLTFHLKQARSGVLHLPRDPESWPEYLLRMNPGDVIFLVDFRRYESNIARLAEISASRRVQVVLLTDKWMSPAKRHATEILAVPIETGTIWDSYVAALATVEAIVSCVAEDTWRKTRNRITEWDAVRNLASEKRK